MKPYLERRKDKKRKRRGLAWSIFFHALLILLALLPFIQADNSSPDEKVYVQFASASAGSSSEGARSSASEQKKSGSADKKRSERAKPAEALPSQSMKEVPFEVNETGQNDNLTASEVNNPEPSVPSSRNTSTLKSRNAAPIQSQVEQAPLGEEEIQGLKNAMNNMNSGSEGGGGSSGGQGESSSSASGTGQGETGTGQSDRGDNGSPGVRSGFINGDGVLTRKIIHKPDDINALVKKEGKLIVNVCIDRRGKVIFSEFDEDDSTIQTMSLKEKAVRAATQYKFAQDPSAPKRECGRISFSVDYDY